MVTSCNKVGRFRFFFFYNILQKSKFVYNILFPNEFEKLVPERTTK